MIGIGYIIVICVLYIHLGLGDTLSKIFRSNLYIFRCEKCITWQSVLAYSLFYLHYDVILSLFTAFVSAYIALWLELFFVKLSNIYNKLYE